MRLRERSPSKCLFFLLGQNSQFNKYVDSIIFTTSGEPQKKTTKKRDEWNEKTYQMIWVKCA